MNPFTLVRRTCQAAEEVKRAADRLQEVTKQKKLIVVQDRGTKVSLTDPDREYKDA